MSRVGNFLCVEECKEEGPVQYLPIKSGFRVSSPLTRDVYSLRPQFPSSGPLPPRQDVDIPSALDSSSLSLFLSLNSSWSGWEVTRRQKALHKVQMLKSDRQKQDIDILHPRELKMWFMEQSATDLDFAKTEIILINNKLCYFLSCVSIC